MLTHDLTANALPANNIIAKLSSHYSEGKFNGNYTTLGMSPKDWFNSTWQFLFTKNNQTPERLLPFQNVDLSFFNSQMPHQLNSTWLGHSSLMIHMDGYRILTDPVFEKKASIVGPKRFKPGLPMDPKSLTTVDVVIISHNHYDHLNKFSIQLLSDLTRQFIVPLKVGKQLIAWGVPEHKIIELDWWQSHQFDANLKITATPSQHFSGRGLFDRNKTLWASWVMTTEKFNIFYSGDSGYFDGFEKIGETFGPFDITFLECGAYNASWKSVHMFPEQTVQAHKDLKGKLLHPIHWGTFNLALHSWYDPMRRLTKSAFSNKMAVATPMPGQTIEYGSNNLGSHWWETILSQ